MNFLNMEESIQKCIGMAEYDFENAHKTLKTNLYDLSILSSQQSVKKIHKALYIQLKCEEPPRIYLIRKLMDLPAIPTEMLEEVADLDSYHLVLLYPEVSELMLFENCSKEDAELALKKNERFIERMPSFLRKLVLVTDTSIEVLDVLCFIPEDFERKKNRISIVREAVNKGIRIL